MRTALYYDPSLEAPLKSLIELYRKANRVEELLGVYKTHTGQFTDDAGSRVVLIRLMRELRKPEAGSMTRAAVKEFPDNSLVRYLGVPRLGGGERPRRSLDALSRAIELETLPGRQRTWIDKLLSAAVAEDRRDLARKHLEELAAGRRAGRRASVRARRENA